MRINGNKLCPHCGYRHSAFRPAGQPASGWDCPGCGRKVKPGMARRATAVMVSLALGIVGINLAQGSTAGLIVFWLVWIPLSLSLFHLAADIRDAESSA